MNIFEKPINTEYVREYLYDLKDDFDREEWNEDFEELPDVLYQNDTVRISHLSEKNVVECVFLGSLRNVGVVKSICKQVQTAAYQGSNHGISATGGFISHGYSFFRNRVSFVN